MSRMVENSQQENLRREEETRRREQEMERREQEAWEEAKRRERAFEQREYDLRHQTQVEMENRYHSEKLAAAEREKEKELIALREKQEIEREKQEMEKLVLCEKQEAERLISEKLLELEKQKNAQISCQLGPGNPRVSAETGSSMRSRDQSEKLSDEFIFQEKIISDADKQLEMQSVSANKLFFAE